MVENWQPCMSTEEKGEYDNKKAASFHVLASGSWNGLCGNTERGPRVYARSFLHVSSTNFSRIRS